MCRAPVNNKVPGMSEYARQGHIILDKSYYVCLALLKNINKINKILACLYLWYNQSRRQLYASLHVAAN